MTFGFKGHACVDEDGFVKALDFTAGFVERIFGILNLRYGMAKARYVGLKRNALRFLTDFFAASAIIPNITAFQSGIKNPSFGKAIKSVKGGAAERSAP